MIQPGLVALINANTGYLAAMGEGVYPLLLPEGVSVGTVYQLAGGNSSPLLAGGSGLETLRIEFTCLAPTYAQADAGRNALRSLFEALDFPAVLPNGSVLRDCEHIQPIDSVDPTSRLYRCGAEYYVLFNLP